MMTIQQQQQQQLEQNQQQHQLHHYQHRRLRLRRHKQGSLPPLQIKGIQNVSTVSCHIACAIQILCHSIPPIRETLRAILACEEEEDDSCDGKNDSNTEKNAVADDKGLQTDDDNGKVMMMTSNIIPISPLVLELIDFVKPVANTNDENDDNEASLGGTIISEQQDHPHRQRQRQPPSSSSWDPRRLYSLLREPSSLSSSSSSSPIILDKKYILEPNEIGDPTTNLSHLLHRLQCTSPEWDTLLQASIWEGKTLQLLQGRKPVPEGAYNIDRVSTRDINNNNPPDVNNVRRNGELGSSAADIDVDDDDDCSPTQRGRCLERIKVAPKSKPMICPLVVNIVDGTNNDMDCCSGSLSSSVSVSALTDTKATSDTITRVSLYDSLQRLLQPHIVDGMPYPWDGLNPESYVERIVPLWQARDDNHSTVVDNSIDNEWVTTKRLEFQTIPRVWLLHLDRRRGHQQHNQQQLRSPLLASTSIRDRTDKDNAWSYPRIVDIPLHLDTELFVSKVASSSSEAEQEEEGWGIVSSTPQLTLQGAIIQVLDVKHTNDNKVMSTREDDLDVEGHCITLLRTDTVHTIKTESDVKSTTGHEDVTAGTATWVLIDDEDCNAVEHHRALSLMGGTMEVTTDDGDHHEDGIVAQKFYAATLLVYAIPGDDPGWDCLIEDIANGWKSQKRTNVSKPGPTQLVGKRLRVKWAKGKFYSGRITHYDVSTGKHRVMYDDGDVKEYNLAKKTIEWLDD
jgi:hypothetical protein